MRLTKILGAMAIALIFSLGLTSCGGFSEKAAEKMVEKYDDGDMKKDDFSKCIDWVEKYYQECEKAFEDVIQDSKNEKKAKKNLEDAEEKIEDKWDGIEDVIEMLNSASYDEDKDMGSSNIKRWDKVKEKHIEKMGKLSDKAEKKFDD